MKRIVEKSFLRLGILGALTCLLLLNNLSPGAVNAQLAWQPDARLEAAILKEDWSRVVALLGSAKNLTAPARLVKAHAYLALNRNNESLCLFLNASSKDDLGKWEEWTRDFARKNPQTTIAHYFRGDALARLRQWDDALMAFVRATELHPKHALALNSRGAIYAARGQWDNALLDFDDATQANPSFADAYASLGAVWIQSRTGPNGALDAFNKALNLSPDFALALNGRGCAQFARGRWEEALRDFKEAREKADCFDMPVINIAALAQAKDDFMKQAGNKLAQLKPGMSTEAMGRYVDSLTGDQVRKSYNQADWNSKMSDTFRGVGEFLQGFRSQSSSRAAVGAAAFVPGITGSASYEQNRTQEWSLSKFGEGLAARSGADKQYWTQFRDEIGSRHPEILKMKPAGVTAEDLQHAYVDKGNWLDTGYGLIYYVEPVKILPKSQEEVKK